MWIDKNQQYNRNETKHSKTWAYFTGYSVEFIYHNNS